MQLSYVIITHDRREPLLRTLRRLVAVTPLPRGEWEAVVVDNGSTDGTAEAVEAAYIGDHPRVRLIRRPTNEGSAARNAGAAAAAGDTLIFLDDDSRPRPGTVRRALDHLRAHRRVGALGGRVMLPDGSEDAAALPIVPPACGLAVRRAAFDAVGGFCPVFFRQAEEYDLVFKLLRAGWRVERLESLAFDHEKVAAARSPELILRMDLRNNLLLAHRHVPRPLRRCFRGDWLRRYAALLRYGGHAASVAPAVRDARRLIAAERPAEPMGPREVEAAFGVDAQAKAVRAWARDHGIRRVVIADHSKTIHATWRACIAAGLQVVAIADNHPAYRGMTYRDAPILPDSEALQCAPARGATVPPERGSADRAGTPQASAALPARPHRPPSADSGAHPVGSIDGVVLSNLNPAQVDRRLDALRARWGGPLLQLWSRPAEPKASPRFGAVVLCRLDSSRLRGKALAPVHGRPVLGVVLDRLRMAGRLNAGIVVATSDRAVDDPIAAFAEREGVAVYRGDIDDAAGRMLAAAEANGFDYAARVNADSPCVDPALLDRACARAAEDDLDFVTNLSPRSFPYGVAVELVRTDCLASLIHAAEGDEREHVTKVLYRHLDALRHANLPCEAGQLSHVRLTIDTPGDLRAFAALASRVGPGWRGASFLEFVLATQWEAAA